MASPETKIQNKDYYLDNSKGFYKCDLSNFKKKLLSEVQNLASGKVIQQKCTQQKKLIRIENQRAKNDK